MEANKNNEELEIDLGELLSVLLSRWILILLAGIVAALAAFSISKFVLPPVYESATAIYVIGKQDTNAVTLADLQMGTQLTKDYVVMIENRTVIEQVIQEMNLDMSYKQFAEALTVEAATDTRVVYIRVRDYDPYLAMEMADKIRDVAAVHIAEVMDIEAVNVAEKANLPTAPMSPNVQRWTMLGALLGVLVAAGSVLLMYLVNDTIKTPDDVERYLGLSTLASIPYYDELDENVKKRKRKKKSKERTGGSSCRK